MADTEGRRLAQDLREKSEEFKKLCEGLDEATASRAPAGRWSPKAVVSHLIGPEGDQFLPALKLALEQDAPRLDIEAENPFFTEERAAMSVKELLTLFDRKYSRIIGFVEGLTDAQLNRKLYVPLLKESPLTDYPTIAAFLIGLGSYHLNYHIKHMEEILSALRGA